MMEEETSQCQTTATGCAEALEATIRTMTMHGGHIPVEARCVEAPVAHCLTDPDSGRYECLATAEHCETMLENLEAEDCSRLRTDHEFTNWTCNTDSNECFWHKADCVGYCKRVAAAFCVEGDEPCWLTLESCQSSREDLSCDDECPPCTATKEP
jgi:hypothetical protein